MEYSQGDIDSLARKLAIADLTDGEIAVLDALVEAAEGEVGGLALGLSFAPLKSAEFLLGHELTHVRLDTAEALNDNARGIVGPSDRAL